MRTREMSYEDYGITENEVRYILDFCRNSNEEEKKLIKSALAEIQPYIAPYIYFSLVDGMSYEKLSVKHMIYMEKVDFYAYRRKGMEAIKRWMIIYNIWEMDI